MELVVTRDERPEAAAITSRNQTSWPNLTGLERIRYLASQILNICIRFSNLRAWLQPPNLIKEELGALRLLFELTHSDLGIVLSSNN
jgi:hypothetical protein